MTFSEALEKMKGGALIRRKGDKVWCWKGGGHYFRCGVNKHLMLGFRSGFSVAEVLADDWETAETAEGADQEGGKAQ